MLRLVPVSDHLHVVRGTMLSFAAMVTWGAQPLAASAWRAPGPDCAMTLTADARWERASINNECNVGTNTAQDNNAF